MTSARSFLSLTAVLLIGALGCSEFTAPRLESDAVSPRNERAGNKKDTSDSPDTTDDGGSTADGGTEEPAGDASTETGELPPGTIYQGADAPPLESYDTTFVATQGQWGKYLVYYRWEKNLDQRGHWFMELQIPDNAQLLRPDGTPAAPGERVEITIRIHPDAFFVEFGPHGSRFDGQWPATLSFNLRYAESSGTPDVWYQPEAGETWDAQETTSDKRGSWVMIELLHFSNYALAF